MGYQHDSQDSSKSLSQMQPEMVVVGYQHDRHGNSKSLSLVPAHWQSVPASELKSDKAITASAANFLTTPEGLDLPYDAVPFTRLVHGPPRSSRRWRSYCQEPTSRMWQPTAAQRPVMNHQSSSGYQHSQCGIPGNGLRMDNLLPKLRLAATSNNLKWRRPPRRPNHSWNSRQLRSSWRRISCGYNLLADPSLRSTSMLLGRKSNQPANSEAVWLLDRKKATATYRLRAGHCVFCASPRRLHLTDTALCACSVWPDSNTFCRTDPSSQPKETRPGHSLTRPQHTSSRTVATSQIRDIRLGHNLTRPQHTSCRTVRSSQPRETRPGHSLTRPQHTLQDCGHFTDQRHQTCPQSDQTPAHPAGLWPLHSPERPDLATVWPDPSTPCRTVASSQPRETTPGHSLTRPQHTSCRTVSSSQIRDIRLGHSLTRPQHTSCRIDPSSQPRETRPGHSLTRPQHTSCRTVPST